MRKWSTIQLYTLNVIHSLLANGVALTMRYSFNCLYISLTVWSFPWPLVHIVHVIAKNVVDLLCPTRCLIYFLITVSIIIIRVIIAGSLYIRSYCDCKFPAECNERFVVSDRSFLQYIQKYIHYIDIILTGEASLLHVHGYRSGNDMVN